MYRGYIRLFDATTPAGAGGATRENARALFSVLIIVDWFQQSASRSSSSPKHLLCLLESGIPAAARHQATAATAQSTVVRLVVA